MENRSDQNKEMKEKERQRLKNGKHDFTYYIFTKNFISHGRKRMDKKEWEKRNGRKEINKKE